MKLIWMMRNFSIDITKGNVFLAGKECLVSGLSIKLVRKIMT